MTGVQHRFRPVRAGIVNLYEYASQTFELADGRLLLRGHNTSGKTKALELLLPFCLDGDTSPRKLDPFARAAKDMKWNLVGSFADREQAVGYVWLEFERLAEDASLERVACGVGLRAHRDQPGVKRWYFVAPGRRVGDDLPLLRGREPVSRSDLAAELGDGGAVLDTATAYRERLNALVFGFPSMDQYRTMLTLMLELRRPHLSKTLDPAGVAELLAAGLPDVDEQLMHRLAAGLEQLEQLEQGLRRLRAVREQLRSFHERTYRAYLRAVVRERADVLRGAASAVEAASGAVRAAAADRGARAAEAERLAGEARDAGGDVQRLEGEERALVTSPGWASVAEVEQLRERVAAQVRAAEAREDAAVGAEAACVADEAELIAAEAAVEDERGWLRAELAELSRVSDMAGLGRRLGALVAQLEGGTLAPDAWSELVRGLAQDWRAVLEEHRALLAADQRAAERLEQRRELERAAEERNAAAGGRRSAAEDALAAERDALAAEIERWRARLTELDPSGDEVAAAHGRAAVGDAPPLGATAERRRRELADARAAELAHGREVAEERAELASRGHRIEAEEEAEPAAPPLRRSSREGRPGAPLWRLVDFAADVPDAERSALEAGLEAAGLLDAWVTRDGRALDVATHDTVLVDGPAAGGSTLADVLVPEPGAPVAGDVVRRLLARVSVDDGSAPAGVRRDGTFTLGPLRGRAAKPRADYIGAGARAERRARLLAELRERDAALAAAADRIAGAVSELDARRATLDDELAAFPGLDAIAAALRELAVATQFEADVAAELEQRKADTARAGEDYAAAQAARREHAARHDLAADTDAAALSARAAACVELGAGVPATARAWRGLAERREQLMASRSRHGERVHEAAELRGAAERERAEATRLAAEHAERERALGQDGAELRDRHEQVASELRAARERLERLVDADRNAAIAAQVAERDHTEREAEHGAARERRDAAHRAFGALGTAGILGLALAERAPEGHRDAAAWTYTRALEAMRALPPDVTSVRAGTAELAQEVLRRVQLLDRELAQADMAAYATPDSDGLYLVRVVEGPGERDLADVLAALDGEIAERERLLTVEERRVFGEALVEELADHLRGRIHAVRARLAATNEVLRRAPTASGKVVQLEWRPVEDEASGMTPAAGLLRQEVRYLGEAERRRLVEFFRARVEDARARQVTDDRPEPMAATLASAFDYRRWFAFGLLEEVDGRSRRLTARRHAVGSGGEQSVLIHLPLFAAAAALYGDSHAPRLVMLDEALSGIDDATRERVLAATVAFDLDLVMTSHELWATYRSVPSLAIYQLHRENGVFGVHAVPFLWDGDVLRELEQAELFVG